MIVIIIRPKNNIDRFPNTIATIPHALLAFFAKKMIPHIIAIMLKSGYTIVAANTA